MFLRSLDKDAMVDDVGFWVEDSWHWSWRWRRQLYTWEGDALVGLQQLLRSVSLCGEDGDEWQWLADPFIMFTVKLAYTHLQHQVGSPSPNNLGQLVFKSFWKCKDPMKVLDFYWRLLLGRLPTRQQLLHKNIIVGVQGTTYVFCFSQVEYENHVFFSCNFSYQVWCLIYFWLGALVVFYTFYEIWSFFASWFSIVGKHLRKYKHLFWHAVTWSWWLMGNKIVFQGGVFDTHAVLHLIKVRS